MVPLKVLDTVRFTCFDDVTVYLLRMVLVAAAQLQEPAELVITSACDGTHSGPEDPHHKGHALDIRSHSFPSSESKAAFVKALQWQLGPSYYVFLESPDQTNEHFHLQLKKGLTSPLAPTEPKKA